MNRLSLWLNQHQTAVRGILLFCLFSELVCLLLGLYTLRVQTIFVAAIFVATYLVLLSKRKPGHKGGKK